MTSESKAPKQELFARQATGLVRELSVKDAFLTSIFSMGFIWPLIYIYSAGSAYPGVNLPLTIWLGLPVCVVIGLAYYLMSAAFPRSGGDYIWVSRIIHPAVGFMNNFVFAVIWMSFVGSLSGFYFLNFGLRVLFVNLGTITGNSGYLSIANSLSGLSTSELLGFTIGLVFIFIATAGSLMGMKATYRILLGTFVVVVIGTLVYCVALLAAGPSGFQAGFNRLSGMSYDSIIPAANSAGFVTAFTLSGTILGSVWTFLNYLGFSNSVYVAGEIKRNSRAQLYGMIGGTVIFALAMFAQFGVSYYVMGGNWLNAASLLSGSGNSAYTLAAPPLGQFLVIFANSNPIIAILVPLGIMAGSFGGAVVVFPIATRSIFAWSFDRVVPEKFSEVNHRGSPTYSILLVLLVGIAFLVLTFFTTFNTLLLYEIAALWVNMAIVGLAVMIFPFKRKDLFSGTPALTRKKLGPIPVVSLAGFATLVSGIGLAYASASPSILLTPVNAPLLLVPVSIFVVGLIVYAVFYFYRRSQKIDLSLTFKEIPPE